MKMIGSTLQASLRSQFNPEGSDLRKYQLRLLEILKFIDKICKDNNIKYWLSCGTCLGAIRHNGFIPWDDDADIEMLPDDYVKFCNILKKSDSDQFVLQTHETDFEYVAPYGKIRDLHSFIKENNTNDLRYKYKGFYVDVFPVYHTSSKFVDRIAGYVHRRMLHKLSLINNNRIRGALVSINHGFLYKIIYPFLALICKTTSKNRFGIGGLGSGFSMIYDSKDTLELIDYEFEGYKFPIPKLYDDYLKSLYGDYMTLPKVEELHYHLNLMKFDLYD